MHKGQENNGFFEDNKGSMFEQEVRMSDKIPVSINKGESSGVNEENATAESLK